MLSQLTPPAIDAPDGTGLASAPAGPRGPTDTPPGDAPPPAVLDVAGTASSASGTLEVHFIDVGQADATLFLHDDATVLIDAGHWERSDLTAYLRAVGVEVIDVLVVTHPHADHLGQFDQVLAAFDVREVWWSGATTTTATFERALTALERSAAAYGEPRAGAQTAVGPLAIDVLSPATIATSLNDASIGLRATYGDVAFVVTGDAEAAAEARMVARHRAWLDADVLRLGHHGSSTSTTPAFLSAVAPAVAIYSAGAGNSYGHPHTETVDRIAGAGIDLYGTDVHGTIVVTTDGTGYRVTTTTGVPPLGPPVPAPSR